MQLQDVRSLAAVLVALRGALRDTVRRQRKSDAPREIGKTYTGTYYESGIHYPDQPLEAEREPAYCDPLKVRSDAVGTDGANDNQQGVWFYEVSTD